MWTKIKNFPKYSIRQDGLIRNDRTGKIRKLHINFRGYPGVSLSFGNKYGEWKSTEVHRLLANAFIPKPENKTQINHIDGNKTNFNLKNLEWVTCSENTRHAFKIGLRKIQSKISYSQAIEIRNLYLKGSRQIKIGEKFGITQAQVSSICLNKNWKNI